MWKPRNKWQLQTKGGCESSGGGGITLTAKWNVSTNAYVFDPAPAGLSVEDIFNATVVCDDVEMDRVLKARLSTDLTGKECLAFKFGEVNEKYEYYPDTGDISCTSDDK